MNIYVEFCLTCATKRGGTQCYCIGQERDVIQLCLQHWLLHEVSLLSQLLYY